MLPVAMLKNVNAQNESITWSTYSDHGVTFQYPSSWNVEVGEQYGYMIGAHNPSIEENGIIASLPYQPIQETFQQYPTLKDFANDYASKLAFATIVEEFTDKVIDGYPAVMGKVMMGPVMMNMMYINHNGQIFTLVYQNIADQYDTLVSKEIEYNAITSFSFI